MKLTVKTLKGTHFDIKVQPNDTVIFFIFFVAISAIYVVSCIARSIPFRFRFSDLLAGYLFDVVD